MIAEIRERVRARHPNGAILGDVPLPDLLPLLHARDAAEGKVASIGTVNPRAPGLLNSIAQSGKKLIARALSWHVREQVEFNRAVMGCVQATIEALNDCNRTMAALSSRMAATTEAAQQVTDLRTHWAHWRVDWEKKLSATEIAFLRSLSELQIAFQHRVNQLDAGHRELMRSQHGDFEASLARSSDSIQKRFTADLEELQRRMWHDMEQIRLEYERIIHAELRTIRQRSMVAAAPAAPSPETPRTDFQNVDWLKFAEKFRGSEPTVRERQQIYAARFHDHAPVLDIGCGRGEMLEVFRGANIAARGIDLDEESIALSRTKGLDVERADLFAYLDSLADSSLGGAVSCQVVEHLPPQRLPEMIRLLQAKVRPGGLVAIETPNPESLAIFATHFYLDPTHRHPLPPALLCFYLEEAGFGGIDVVRLNPTVESMPSVADLPREFREQFFGALDYAVFARKLG